MKQSRELISVSLLIVAIFMTVLLAAPAKADDNSTAAHTQAIQCLLFARMAKLDHHILKVLGKRIPKEFSMENAYTVGKAEGLVIGTAMLTKHVSYSVALEYSAEQWYDIMKCTINEDT